MSKKNEFNISVAHPLKDYQKLIETKVQVDEIVDDEVTKENFSKAAAAARDVIWRLLFSSSSAADDSQKMAAELLEEYKGDACFYAPWAYNDWIVELRDELLKHNLLDFWRDTIVKKQLGPCWSRDSDLFDSDDTPPVEFYAHAGCVAPFAASLKVRAAVTEASPGNAGNANTENENVDDILTGNFEAVISTEDPLSDYRNLMKRYALADIIVPDAVHKASIGKIAQAARDAIWALLFDGTPQFDKAAELLEEYKGDASFYEPWAYNEWIVGLRDKVLECKFFDFWREKIVKLELGPCCARDSDLFEADDALPCEFYEKAGCKAPFTASENEK